MKYTPQNLVSQINDIAFDEEQKNLKEYSFEFDDCYVDINGFVWGTYDYEQGDYWQPPTSELTDQVADIYEVAINYEENSEFLNGEEIKHIEKLLKDVYY